MNIGRIKDEKKMNKTNKTKQIKHEQTFNTNLNNQRSKTI
jgi:hypothetical protein